MALKEKALKRLAEKLKAAGVAWVLSGDYALQLRGVDTEWHGFELMVTMDAYEKADKVLTRLGMRHEEEGPAEKAVAYHFDGADILLLAGPRDIEVQAEGEAAVLGVPVPLLKVSEQMKQLTGAGKAELAAKLQAVMA